MGTEIAIIVALPTEPNQAILDIVLKLIENKNENIKGRITSYFG